MLKVGQRLGSYEVVAQLTSGGMATLFLARRVGAAGFARPVALKVVQPELARDPHFVRMFIDEAKLAARIQHPNVVHVEELGERDGFYFLAMEYVHGVSLAELLRELHSQKRRLAPAVATYIATQVADALHAAHETRSDKGKKLEVVHRDVSPQNILISSAGHVKLIDFGIAKALGRQSRTNVGALKGKLRYMSPEQAHGRPVDRSTDLYALGIVLWEMLTMRRLFRAPSELALLDQVRAPNIESPDTLVSDLPAGLVTAVMKALSIEAQHRPASALELRRALASAVAGVEEVDSTQLADLLDVVLGPLLAERADLLPPDTREHTLGAAAIPDEISSAGLGRAFEPTVNAAMPQTQAGRPRRATPKQSEGNAALVSKRTAPARSDAPPQHDTARPSGITADASAKLSPSLSSPRTVSSAPGPDPSPLAPSATRKARAIPKVRFMDTVTVSMKDLESDEWVDLDLDDAIVEELSAERSEPATSPRARSVTPARPRSITPNSAFNDRAPSPDYAQPPQGRSLSAGPLRATPLGASGALASATPQRLPARALSQPSYAIAPQSAPWARQAASESHAMFWPDPGNGRTAAALAEAQDSTRVAQLVPSAAAEPRRYHQAPVSGTYSWDDSGSGVEGSDMYESATSRPFISAASGHESAFADAVADFDRTQARRHPPVRARLVWIACALLAGSAGATWALKAEAPRAALRTHLDPSVSSLLGLNPSEHFGGTQEIAVAVVAPTLPLQAAREAPKPADTLPISADNAGETEVNATEVTSDEKAGASLVSTASSGATTSQGVRRDKGRQARPVRRPKTRNASQDADNASQQVVAEVPIFSLPGR